LFIEWPYAKDLFYKFGGSLEWPDEKKSKAVS
jgi:hypothetical protein